MSDRRINRLVALGVFLTAAGVYLRTLSATVVFWDVGEFCAAARLLQVPHPPGSPLFLFVARLASIIPFRDDIAARMHAVSALASAGGIMFLYLIGVDVITRLRAGTSDRTGSVIAWGASAVGSLALAFSTSYWDNAIETEVYGVAMFFVALIVWLAFRWREHADDEGSGRYLLMIAWLFGLSAGVHILALLGIIPVLTMVYLKYYQVSGKSLIRFTGFAAGFFILVYPGIILGVPSLLDGQVLGIRSDLLPYLPLVVLGAVAVVAVRSARRGSHDVALAAASLLLITLAYTTYIQVLIRANVPDLPMKEGAPGTLAGFSAYVGREQYGQTPQLKGQTWNNERQEFVDALFPRRWSVEPRHQPTRANYSNDWDFFWRYQTNKMFIRYLSWNFIGVAGDWQDAGVRWGSTFGIPFLLAVAGAVAHFRRDRKIAAVFLVMFLLMGPVLAWYQNQQDAQPRERDYFYVGAYFCMALWIGIAVAAGCEGLRRIAGNGPGGRGAVAGALILAFAAVPGSLFRMNFDGHDRSGQYIAWDYSYNLLQSCEPDAILFTNADNDTFPLWYLQDVEGIRRDVRIVCLSLSNASWYIKQLKHERPFGSKPVPVSMTDEQIDQLVPQIWAPVRMSLKVPPDVYQQFRSADAAAGSPVVITDSTAMTQGAVPLMLNGVPYRADSRVFRIQDMLVSNIVTSSQWSRPIYFSATCSPDSRIGLDDYLWFQGLAFRLKPYTAPTRGMAVDIAVTSRNLLAADVKISRGYRPGYLYRNLNNPAVHYDEDVRRMSMNYRSGFLRLAQFALTVQHDQERARQVLTAMDGLMPVGVLPIGSLSIESYVVHLMNDAAAGALRDRYSADLETRALAVLDRGPVNPEEPLEPYQVLLDLYEFRGNYRAAIAVLDRLGAEKPGIGGLTERREYFQQMLNNPPTGTKPAGQ